MTDHPHQGGSYTRDKITGKLKLVERTIELSAGEVPAQKPAATTADTKTKAKE
jgi:hypothetical protein